LSTREAAGGPSVGAESFSTTLPAAASGPAGRVRPLPLYDASVSRFLVSAFGGLVVGIASLGAVSFLSATILSRLSSGSRDGGDAMQAFFFFGPVGGVLGLGLGAWLAWRLLADPSRTGAVVTGLLGLALATGIAASIALSPPAVKSHDFPPGRRGELQVEARFPSSTLKDGDTIRFVLRDSGSVAEAKGEREKIRREDGHDVLPGTFPLSALPQFKVLALMNGDRQIDTTSLEYRDEMKESSPWTGWQPLQGSAELRWRLAVVPR
jgi:hypothetical protein